MDFLEAFASIRNLNHPRREHRRELISDEHTLNQKHHYFTALLSFGDTTRNQSFVTLMTTLPTCLWDSKYEYALMASSNENILSTTGWICRAIKRRFMSSNLECRPVSSASSDRQGAVTHCLTEPMRIPRKLRALPIMARTGIPFSPYADAIRLNACKTGQWRVLPHRQIR